MFDLTIYGLSIIAVAVIYFLFRYNTTEKPFELYRQKDGTLIFKCTGTDIKFDDIKSFQEWMSLYMVADYSQYRMFGPWEFPVLVIDNPDS